MMDLTQGTIKHVDKEEKQEINNQYLIIIIQFLSTPQMIIFYVYAYSQMMPNCIFIIPSRKKHGQSIIHITIIF